MPDHHLRAIRNINLITFAGFLLAIYGLVLLDVTMTVFGTLATMLGKTWFLDRMVWLFQDLSSENDEYSSWLY